MFWREVKMRLRLFKNYENNSSNLYIFGTGHKCNCFNFFFKKENVVLICLICLKQQSEEAYETASEEDQNWHIESESGRPV